MPFRHDGRELGAKVYIRRFIDIWLVKQHAVAAHLTRIEININLVARAPDHPLDDRRLAVRGAVDDNDIAILRIVITRLHQNQAVAVVQRRRHRRA